MEDLQQRCRWAPICEGFCLKWLQQFLLSRTFPPRFPQVARWNLRDWAWGCAGHEEIAAVTAHRGRWIHYQCQQSRFFGRDYLKNKQEIDQDRWTTGKRPEKNGVPDVQCWHVHPSCTGFTVTNPHAPRLYQWLLANSLPRSQHGVSR